MSSFALPRLPAFPIRRRVAIVAGIKGASDHDYDMTMVLIHVRRCEASQCVVYYDTL